MGNRSALWVCVVCAGSGCAWPWHDTTGSSDAAGDTQSDAAEPPLTMANNEGGEIRLEWVQNSAGQTTGRITAFFYKSEDPPWNPIPDFPGCFDMRAHDKWPLAAGTIVPLDVGGVAVRTSTALVTTNPITDPSPVACSSTAPCATGQFCDPATQTCTVLDPFNRSHPLWYQKGSSFTAATIGSPTATGDGWKYPQNERYDVYFEGSSEWPRQEFKQVAFMPAYFSLISPTSAETAMLQADTDFTWTYTPGNSTNLPYDLKVSTITAFKGPDATAMPLVICQEPGTDGSVTVPKDLVNLLRTYGNGTYVRQNITHRMIELTDGTARALKDRKRIDVLTISCYNSSWVAAP